MKSIKFLSVITLTILFSVQVSAQKTVLTHAEIPVEIINYITQNFKDHRILKANKEVEDHTIKFETKLNKKVELEFDETFKIKEIEMKNGMPLKLIPPPIANYVQSHYPNLKVVQWKLNKKGQKIELSNKYEIQFDAKGNFIKTKIK